MKCKENVVKCADFSDVEQGKLPAELTWEYAEVQSWERSCPGGVEVVFLSKSKIRREENNYKVDFLRSSSQINLYPGFYGSKEECISYLERILG